MAVDAASDSPIDSGWSAGTGERHWCMASVRRKSAVLGIIAGAMLTIGTVSAAWAEDPVQFGSSPVVDTVGALGDQLDEVEAAIDRAADSSGRQLFVAYVDEFTNPEAADAWANDTAIANNMGAEDYLLAVAVDGRAYYLSADSEASLSDADVARISSGRHRAEAARRGLGRCGDRGGRRDRRRRKRGRRRAGDGSGSSSSEPSSSRSSRSCSRAAGASRPAAAAVRRADLHCPRSTTCVDRRAALSCRPTTP